MCAWYYADITQIVCRHGGKTSVQLHEPVFSAGQDDVDVNISEWDTFFLLKNILSAHRFFSCNLPDWWLGPWRLSCSQEVMCLTLSFSLLADSPCSSRYSWAAPASSRSNFQIVCSHEHEQESVICPKICFHFGFKLYVSIIYYMYLSKLSLISLHSYGGLCALQSLLAVHHSD